MNRFKQHSFFITIGSVCILLFFLGPKCTEWLQYDRNAIDSGQILRFLTGHLVHSGWAHFLLNMGGLLLIWALFPKALPNYFWFLVFLASAELIGLGLFLWSPEVSVYVGLSGVLKGLFVAGSIAKIQARQWEGWLFLGLITFALIWEGIFGSLPGSSQLIGASIGRQAHLLGALAGLLVLFKRKNKALP